MGSGGLTAGLARLDTPTLRPVDSEIAPARSRQAMRERRSTRVARSAPSFPITEASESSETDPSVT